MQATKNAKTKARKNKAGTAPPPVEKTKRPTPVKVKQPTPKQRVTAAKARGETALDAVYGTGGDREGELLPELRFDPELRRLAEAVRDDVGDLRETNILKRTEFFDKALGRLDDRLRETRGMLTEADRLSRAATAVGRNLGTEPLFDGALAKYVASKNAVDQRIPRGWLKELDIRVGMMTNILAAINSRPDTAALTGIPQDLINAAGTVATLRTLERAVEHVPDPVALRDLLRAVDTPSNVPALMDDAVKAGLDVSAVLTECGGNTLRAEQLLKRVNDSGHRSDYFLAGEGGQRLQDLRYAAVMGSPVWSGKTVAETGLHYGASGGPTVSFASIKAVAEGLPPVGEDLPDLPDDEPDRPRYIGNRPYGNDGSDNGMVLPAVTADGATRIYYREFDIRPYTGAERGKERVVEGTDGRRYYTSDHYQTFRRIT